MTRLIAVPAVAAGLLWAPAAPATAAIRCGPHELVTSMLAQEYQEQREAIGLSEAGLLMEVFVSPGGTWTILMTTPAGLACIIASGDSFEASRTQPPEV